MNRKNIAMASLALIAVAFSCATATAFVQANGGNEARQGRVVRNGEELNAALAAAKPGDRLQLAPGSYDNINIFKLMFAPDAVTLTALDPKQPPRLRNLTVNASRGLAFDRLELIAPEGGAAVNVWWSQDIAFSNVKVHGQLDGSHGRGDGQGIIVQGSQDVQIVDSELHELLTGIGHHNVTGFVVARNFIHDIQLDGIRGGGSSNVKILDNRLEGFFSAPGDHSDAIQFWTSDTNASAHDIVIRGNVAARGAGLVMEGLFMRDETDGRLPYRNVTIENNAFIGTNWEGIAVYHADNVTVTGNLVAGWKDQGTRFNMTAVKNLTMTDNHGSEYGFAETGGVNKARNVTIKYLPVGDTAYLAQWLQARGR